MIKIEDVFSYLIEKVPGFTKTTKRGQFLFTCPREAEHKLASASPTMTNVAGSDKFYCLLCGYKGTAYDLVRLVEKKQMTDEQVISLLTNEMNIDAYPELEKYKTLNWSLVPIAKNGKNPLEKDWTNKTHLDKSEWLKWIEQGLNIGARTGGISHITVIDVDLKVSPTEALEEVYKLLTASKTLTQNTPHGKHFIFQYDKDLVQAVGLGGLTIDIRNDGGQILVAPSKINNSSYSWLDADTEIKVIAEDVKSKLLSLTKVDKNRTKELSPEVSEQIKQIGEGGRNDTLTSLGGLLINKLSPDQTELVLSIINQKFMQPPLPVFELKAMLGSLEGYKNTEEQTQENAVYECCQLIQSDISAKDVMEHTGVKRAIADKYLAKFHKEGKLSRKGRGRYDCKQKVEWSNEEQDKGTEYPFKIPYFDDVAYFKNGDIILIGAPTGRGKTTIAINFIKQMRAQGVTPFYLSLEAGSRHEKTANALGLTQKDYYIPKDAVTNPLQIEIEPNSFSIIDWLYCGEDFAQTQAVFKHLNDEMVRKGGILVVFTQLKENHDYFAINLVKSFPRFSARFIYDDESGIVSHFQIDKITDPKGHYQNAVVNTIFNFDTKELKKKDNL